MTGLGGSILLVEAVQNVTHAQTVTAHLVGIRRTDALTRGANLVLTLCSLIGSVQHTVRGHNQVCLLRDVQTRLQLVAARLQGLCLVHEEVRGKDHTVANDVDLATLENARGHRAQHVLLTLELQRVTSIRTTLETGYHIILRGQHVDHLTFSFIAPLQSQQNVNFSFVHCCFFLSFILNFLLRDRLSGRLFRRLPNSLSGSSLGFIGSLLCSLRSFQFLVLLTRQLALARRANAVYI